MTPVAEQRSAAAGRLRADKHDAIIDGGRETFAREGYQRASIDTIAAASGVSTRTIYKHFADKSALFAAVVGDSAAHVAEEETALINRHLAEVSRAEEVAPALQAFATEWLTGTARSATHRALVRQVRAEAAHLGQEVVTAWWLAGPGRVLGELAAVLANWSEAGLLHAPDPELAAAHFAQLVSVTTGPPAPPGTERDRTGRVAASVQVFVRGHRP